MSRILATSLAGWRRFYGANPLHLLALLAGAALVAYTVGLVATESMATRMLIWFVGALVAHDLVLFPLYALADRSLLVGRWARRRLTGRHEPRVPVINHLRVPALGSGLLLLVFLPVIIGQGESAYVAATGMNTDPYFQRWLWLSGGMFAISAVIYAGRLVVAAAVHLRDARRASAKTATAPARNTTGRAAAGATGPVPKDDVTARVNEPTAQGRDRSSDKRSGAVDSTTRSTAPDPEQATADTKHGNVDPPAEDNRP